MLRTTIAVAIATLAVGLGSVAVAQAMPRPHGNTFSTTHVAKKLTHAPKAHASLHSLEWAVQQACAANATMGNYLVDVYLGPHSGCAANRGGWNASIQRFDVYIYYYSIGNGCNNHPWWSIGIHAWVTDGGAVTDKDNWYVNPC
jgi:hypothetical protein